MAPVAAPYAKWPAAVAASCSDSGRTSRPAAMTRVMGPVAANPAAAPATARVTRSGMAWLREAGLAYTGGKRRADRGGPEMDRDYDKPEPTRDEVDRWPGPAVLEFGAGWCPHCQGAQPAIAAALDRFPNVRHVKVGDGKGKPLGRSFQVKLW